MYAAGADRTYRLDEVHVLTGEECKPLPAFLQDHRQVTRKEKHYALELAGGQVHLLADSAMMESAEVLACLPELLLRARLAKCPFVDSTCIVDAVAMQPALALPPSELSSTSPLLTGLRQSTLPIRNCSVEDCLLFCPVHCAEPPHWTLLCLERVSGVWSVFHYDSCLPPLAGSETQAAKCLLVLTLALEAPATLGLPETVCHEQQFDGWSCGYHCLAAADSHYRKWRGEGRSGCLEKPTALKEKLNKWLTSVRTALPRPPAAAAPAPLPAPATHAEPLPLADLTSADNWGCSRCRYSKRGCQSCNPYKFKRPG